MAQFPDQTTLHAQCFDKDGQCLLDRMYVHQNPDAENLDHAVAAMFRNPAVARVTLEFIATNRSITTIQ